MKFAGLLESTAVRAFSSAFAISLVFILGLPQAVPAQEATLEGLSVPQFDAAGNLIRQLKAESGKGWTGKKSQLQKGTVEFFSGEKDLFAEVATLEFAEATYDPLTGLIVGEGHVVLHAPRGDLSGEGFRYDLARNHLWLNSRVTFDLTKGVRVEGGEAEADLAQGQAKGTPLIVWAAVKKGVVVTADTSAKLEFDRARTESAVYTAIDEKVVLASPVETSRQGEKTVIEAQAISFQLGKKSAAPFAPAAKSRTPVSSP